MSKKIRKKLKNSKKRIEYRLRERNWPDQPKPIFTASNIHYELSEKSKAISAGGIGAIHKLVRFTGLDREIDQNLHLLKIHKPYHESDHVLNIAYNILAGGTRLEDLELLRNNEVYLNALGAQRIPDPTTAGDFCRRFDEIDVEWLLQAIDQARLRVWKMQCASFFEEAVIDADGSMAETLGECKEGMDISYNGIWGFHPLIISLANTGEVLYLINRSGNRPSHEGAYYRFDQAVDLCRSAGFKKITLRGDTDFSQTEHLDRWDAEGVRFVFGMDAGEKLVDLANNLSEASWAPLRRGPKYEVKTEPRQRPEKVKERIVREREFTNIRLASEEVASFRYSPSKCKKDYRIVVVRKNLSVERGELMLFDDIRYFFYLTNDFDTAVSQIVFEANKRCNQENLVSQLKSGVRALHAPLNNLVSNWAYMVIAALAWNLKAWFALLLPEKGRWGKKYRSEKKKVLKMEFKTFLNAFMRIPAQIIRQGRRIIYRILSWNPWQPVFFRLVDRLHGSLRC